MNKDIFGNIFYEGKIIDIDKEDINKLKEISQKLVEKNRTLEEKMDKIFYQ